MGMTYRQILYLALGAGGVVILCLLALRSTTVLRKGSARSEGIQKPTDSLWKALPPWFDRLTGYWILLAWGTGLCGVLWHGRLSNPAEMYNSSIGTASTYPWNGVLIISVILSIEAFVLWAIMRPKTYTNSWPRAFCGMILFVPLFFGFGILSMHMPPYYLCHLTWLLMVSAVLWLMTVVGILRSVHANICNKPSSPDPAH